VEFSESLTAQLYLLAYDMRKQRLQRSIGVVELLRAAAFADLQFCGRLADQAGKVRVSSREPVGEPVLDAVLQGIIKSKPRSWQQWVSLGGGFQRTVQDRLATLQVIKLEQRRILRIFPSTRIIVHQPHTITELTARVRGALLDAQPVCHVDPHDAALVALAAAADLTTVLPWRQRRAHKKRIAQLTERTGPVVPALRKAIQANNAAATICG
jgi:hypothetical protein